MERDGPSTDADSVSDVSDDTEADEWQFGADEFESDIEREAAEAAEEAEEGEERRGSVAGGTDRAFPVEPEPVDLENALFVLLGVVVTLAVFAQFVVG